VFKPATIILCACLLGSGCRKNDVRAGADKSLAELTKEHLDWTKRQPRPTDKDVHRIEVLLRNVPCIGRLDRWARSYSIKERIPSQTLYPDMIDFSLKEAGRFGVNAGVQITEPSASVQVDDTPIKMAWGDYEISTGKITFAFCGQNTGRPKQAREIHNMDEYWDNLEARLSKHQSVSSR
jgi:hypothetical protein